MHGWREIIKHLGFYNCITSVNFKGPLAVKSKVSLKFSLTCKPFDATLTTKPLPWKVHQLLVLLNPFTATARKIYGLKDARTCMQKVYFPSYNIYFQRFAFSWLSFYMPVQKRKQKRSEIAQYYWSFSSDIMAVKGLKWHIKALLFTIRLYVHAKVVAWFLT